MTFNTKEFQDLDRLFNPLLGKISYQSYFSYIGLFKDGTMFALYKNQSLYFRKSCQYAHEIENTIPLHFLNNIGTSQRSKVFYHVPDFIIKNLAQYVHWITSSIQEFEALRTKTTLNNRNKIRCLPNMNIALERLLNRVNIHTVEEFKRLGEFHTFVRLVQQGTVASETLLFKLHGALQQKYIYALTKQEKRDLLAEADNILYDSGLRKRFVGSY